MLKLEFKLEVKECEQSEMAVKLRMHTEGHIISKLTFVIPMSCIKTWRIAMTVETISQVWFKNARKSWNCNFLGNCQVFSGVTPVPDKSH